MHMYICWIMSWWTEPWRHTVVVSCVCMSFCNFTEDLGNCYKVSSKKVQLITTKSFIWLHFRVKSLFSSYGVIWQPLSAIQSLVKSKLSQQTAFYFEMSTCTTCKIDGNLSEISRTGMSKFSSLWPGPLRRKLQCIKTMPRLFLAALARAIAQSSSVYAQMFTVLLSLQCK